MRILVTGGAGFIGAYVCKALLERDYAVRVLDNLDPQVHGPDQKWPDYLPSGLDLQQGDIRDHEAVAKALDGCDAVIHLASAVGVGQSMYEIERYCSVNVIGTAVLLEEIVKRKESIRKLVVAGSMSSYGEGEYRDAGGNRAPALPRPLTQLQQNQWEVLGPDRQPLTPVPTTEEKPMEAQSVYAINKRDQEEMCHSVGRAYNIPTIVLRMFNVFGAYQALSNPYTGVVAIFCSKLLTGQAPMIYEDGNQKRDFVYVEDVAQAYVAALESEAGAYQSFNVGSGRSITISEVAKTLSSVLNIPIEAQVTGKFRDGDVRHCFADISKAEKVLGWTPNFAFADGLRVLTDWLKTQQAQTVTSADEELKRRGLLK